MARGMIERISTAGASLTIFRDAPTLDGVLSKINAMALDLLPDNFPGVDPASVYLQITALREAAPAAA